MFAKLEIYSFPHVNRGGVGLYGYAQITVKFECHNDKCRYEERTKGKSTEAGTIQSLLNLAEKFRGGEMFKQGKFADGSVGVNRRRHIGIHAFEPVPNPRKSK